MRLTPIITPPFGAVAPPMRPVPDPRAMIGHAGLEAAPDDGHDLGGRPREGDQVGQAVVVDEHVALVDQALVGRGHEAVGAHDLAERIQEAAVHGHARGGGLGRAASGRRPRRRPGRLRRAGGIRDRAAQRIVQVSPDVKSRAMSPGPRSDTARFSWSAIRSS